MNGFENVSNASTVGSWTTVRQVYENTEGLDLEKALENTVTLELLEDVLHDYWEGIKEGADEIEQLMNSEDYKLYTVKVHALKSSSRIVGITKLGDMAYELELAGYEAEKGDAQAIRKIKENTPAVLEKYRSYSDIFSGIFNNA